MRWINVLTRGSYSLSLSLILVHHQGVFFNFTIAARTQPESENKHLLGKTIEERISLILSRGHDRIMLKGKSVYCDCKNQCFCCTCWRCSTFHNMDFEIMSWKSSGSRISFHKCASCESLFYYSALNQPKGEESKTSRSLRNLWSMDTQTKNAKVSSVGIKPRQSI